MRKEKVECVWILCFKNHKVAAMSPLYEVKYIYIYNNEKRRWPPGGWNDDFHVYGFCGYKIIKSLQCSMRFFIFIYFYISV